MALTPLPLLLLSVLAYMPAGGKAWHVGQLVYGDEWPARVCKEADEMDNVATALETTLKNMDVYVQDMIDVSQQAEREEDEWKKKALLLIMQTRLEELRIVRKDVKHRLATLSNTISRVARHARGLKKQLPLWYIGIQRKLRTAQRVVETTTDWLELRKNTQKIQKEKLKEHLQRVELYKLPPLLGTSG